MPSGMVMSSRNLSEAAQGGVGLAAGGVGELWGVAVLGAAVAGWGVAVQNSISMAAVGWTWRLDGATKGVAVAAGAQAASEKKNTQHKTLVAYFVLRIRLRNMACGLVIRRRRRRHPCRWAGPARRPGLSGG